MICVLVDRVRNLKTVAYHNANGINFYILILIESKITGERLIGAQP